VIGGFADLQSSWPRIGKSGRAPRRGSLQALGAPRRFSLGESPTFANGRHPPDLPALPAISRISRSHLDYERRPEQTPDMSDWGKILVSALAGVVTGIFLEPIRRWIGDAITARYAKRAIYEELGGIYHLATRIKSGQGDPLRVVRKLNCQAFDYYYASKREVVYLIPEYQGLISIFDKVRRLKALHQDGAKLSAQEVEVLSNMIERLKESAEIDGAALTRGANKFAKRVRKGMAQVRAAKVDQ